MRFNRDLQLDKIQRDSEALSPKWDAFIKPIPPGSGIYAEENAEIFLRARSNERVQ